MDDGIETSNDECLFSSVLCAAQKMQEVWWKASRGGANVGNRQHAMNLFDADADDFAELERDENEQQTIIQ